MEWKDIEGFEGMYQVSDSGLVKSLARTIYRKKGRTGGATQFIQERIMKPAYDRNGYVRVYLTRNGDTKPKLVHRLVWETFEHNIPKTYQIDHIDMDKQNNRFSNLRCLSRREHGQVSTIKEETKSFALCKLTEEQVAEIRELLKDEQLSLREIGNKYGVSPSTIQAIHRGRTWRKSNTESLDSRLKAAYTQGYEAALKDKGGSNDDQSRPSPAAS